MDKRELVYSPRAQRDLLAMPGKFAGQVLDDLALLEFPHWPPGKVKKLKGGEYWEIKTGDWRTVFWPEGKKVVVLRVVNRRDLDKTLGRINLSELIRWLGMATQV